MQNANNFFIEDLYVKATEQMIEGESFDIKSEDRERGGSKELENQISKNVKEAEKNYDDTHKKTGN